MGRLNQSRRQKIGYTYDSQVNNDISITPSQRQMGLVLNQAFSQNMKGDGLKEVIRGIYNNRESIKQHTGEAIDLAVKGINFIDPKTAQKVKQALPKNTQELIEKTVNTLGGDPRAIKVLQDVHDRRGDISHAISTGVKLSKNLKKDFTGSGLGVAGGMLPGDMLRKKLLQKMVREKRMSSLGDRRKTRKLQGGSLVIGGTSSGQSRSRDLAKGYNLNPHPLIGSGVGDISPNKIIAHLKKFAVPIMKAEGVISKTFKNSDQVKKYIEIHAKKILEKVKDPLKAITTVFGKLKPLFKGQGLGLAGAGLKETFARMGWKLLAGIFRAGSAASDGPSQGARFASYMGNYKGSGLALAGKGMNGGFIFSIAAIIAAVSAAAAAAASSAAAVGAVTVAGTTIGAIAAATAATAGTAVVGTVTSHMVKKALEAGDRAEAVRLYKKMKAQKKGRGMSGHGIDSIVAGVIKKTKLTLKDLPAKHKQILKKGFIALKDNPTKAGVLTLGKKLAPVARDIMIKKVNKELKKTKTGISLKGSGLGLAGAGRKPIAKTFDKTFVKAFTNKLTK